MVELPGYAELVGAGAEVGAPEHVLEGHGNGTAGGDAGKETVGLFTGLRVAGDGKVVAGLVGRAEAGGGVAAHENAVADGEADVHDALAIFLRHAHVGRAFAEGRDVDEVAAEDGAIEFEHFAAVAVEVEIDTECHSCHLDSWCCMPLDRRRAAIRSLPGRVLKAGAAVTMALFLLTSCVVMQVCRDTGAAVRAV